jgi:hypothetical protein
MTFKLKKTLKHEAKYLDTTFIGLSKNKFRLIVYDVKKKLYYRTGDSPLDYENDEPSSFSYDQETIEKYINNGRWKIVKEDNHEV